MDVVTVAFMLATSSCSAYNAWAQSQWISQTRINEFAGVLVRARRALVEDTGHRRPDEPLDKFMVRLASAAPGESTEHVLLRRRQYLVALMKVSDGRSLCTGVPALRDNSVNNRAAWVKATRASMRLSNGIDRMIKTSEAKPQDTIGGSRDPLNPHQLTRLALAIQDALDGFRRARP